MKTRKPLFILILIAVFLVSATSCRVFSPGYHHPSRTVIISTNPSGKVPPGQMKKATGAQSAKEYAPGQNKYKAKGKKNKKK
jgi:hypothetical protein